MVFSTNPLALSVPDSTFESWLRDSGYLEVLDRRSSSSSAVLNTTSSDHPTATLFSNLLTLFSLFTLNPISKLTSDDFSGPTPSWTGAFFGDCGSYSFPSASDQAKRRVHENVKRYARNYASLFILFLACSLYQMPLALIGLVSSLAIWDSFKYFSDRWGWDRYPFIRQILVRTAQCATAVILIYSNVQMAIFCAMAVSYVVMILHAAFRKLTPAKQPSQQR